MSNTYSAGLVTAYGAAVRGGYQGTYEQWCLDMANLGDNVAEVRQKAAQVEQTAQEFTEETVPAAVLSVEDKGTEQINAVGTAGAAQVQEINDTAVLRIGAVNAAGAAQVQDVNTAGATQVQAVNTAGQTALTAVSGAQTSAVAAVQAESTTQQAAIQQKGEDTIESIPSDYTALSDEVNDLKSAVNENLFIDRAAQGELIAIDNCVKDTPAELSIDIPYQSGGFSSFTMRHRHRNMLDLIDSAAYADINYTVLDDGTLKIDGGPATGNSRYGVFGDTRGLNVNNTYNLPAGEYTVYFYDVKNNVYLSQWYIYEGTSTTLIYNLPAGKGGFFETAENKNARVCSQFQKNAEPDSIVKCFMGAGVSTLEQWDAPVRTNHEITVSLGTQIYGGTVDIVNKKVYSTYNSDGTVKETPDVFDLTIDIPELYSGFNTIWASIPGVNISIQYKELFVNANNIDTEIKSQQKDINVLNSAYLATYFPVSMFQKIGIIGDSYASGSLYDADGVYVDTINSISWGKNIERMYGIDVSLFSKGGLSTRTWLTDSHGLSALQSDTVKDLYWFGLGINDVSIYAADSTYLGSIEDITQHQSGAEWASTFYGNIGRILDAIKTKAPNAIIVISSFGPTNRTPGSQALNTALKTIADTLQLPYINQEDDSFYLDALYQTCKRGSHPTTMLYAGMANANVRLLGRCIYNNPDMFVGFIPEH